MDFPVFTCGRLASCYLLKQLWDLETHATTSAGCLMPDSSSAIFPGATRSNSLASTVSSSGASLTRRSRIRKRTRTTTESSRPECVPSEFDTVLDISASHTQELVSTSVDGPSETPIDPPASHSETGNTTSNPNTSNGTCGTFGQAGRKGTTTPGSGGVGPAGSQPEPPRRVEIIAAPTTFVSRRTAVTR